MRIGAESLEVGDRRLVATESVRHVLLGDPEGTPVGHQLLEEPVVFLREVSGELLLRIIEIDVQFGCDLSVGVHELRLTATGQGWKRRAACFVRHVARRLFASSMCLFCVLNHSGSSLLVFFRPATSHTSKVPTSAGAPK